MPGKLQSREEEEKGQEEEIVAKWAEAGQFFFVFLPASGNVILDIGLVVSVLLLCGKMVRTKI